VTEPKLQPAAAVRDRFQALDAWRGVCALVVALEHLNVANVLHQNALVFHGFRFVDFFFVLSGFVISHAYRERLHKGWAETRPFLIRRVGRLWPLHVSILLAFVGLHVLLFVGARMGISLGEEAFGDRNTAGQLVGNVALVHGLGVFDNLTWNGPSWSISVEAFAYIAFAGLCALLTTTRRLLLGAVVVMAGAFVIIVFVAPKGMSSTFDFGVFRCLYGFMAGVLVRSLWARYTPRIGTIGETLVVVAIIATVSWLPRNEWAVLVTPLFAVAVWIFASENGGLSRALLTRWPQALGAWSYSIYMVHVLIAVGLLSGAMVAARSGLSVFARVDGVVAITGPTWFTTAVLVFYLAMVVGVASLTYRYIELPGQKLFGRWAKRRAT
jgi:peptidoglycan/LPS O-acetylase OafA/YrhL